MRTLDAAPETFLDDRGAPRFGSYRGALPPIDVTSLAKGPLALATRRKRWLYLAAATQDHYVAVASVHLGYAVTVFAFVYDRAGKRMLADASSLGPPVRQRFSEHTPSAPGESYLCNLQTASASLVLVRGHRAAPTSATFNVGAISGSWTFDFLRAPPPIAVVAEVPGGVVDATEKRALIRCHHGWVEAGGERIPLDGAFAGYDYTHGLLARHTAWKWAFGMGHAKTGERVAWNLVEGFVGEPECCVWVDDELHGVGVGRFGFDAERPLEPWTVKTACGAVDLRFTPGAMHAETKNLGLVASRFVQPAGTFSGTLDVAGKRLELEDVLGVTEDQDVLW